METQVNQATSGIALNGAAFSLDMRDAAEVRMTSLAEQIAGMIRRIYDRRLTTTSGGNISMRDVDGTIWVTPSGVDKGSLSPEAIIGVKPDGTVVKSDGSVVKPDGSTTGSHKPSIEFPFHKAIYEARPDIRAIIHAHSPDLAAFAIVHQVPDTRIIRHAKAVCGEVRCAAYAIPGSDELGRSIAEQFSSGANAVLMKNHGIVVGGRNMEEAFERFETLEFCAYTINEAKTFGEPRYLTDNEISKFDEATSSMLPEMETSAHPADELDLRGKIAVMVRRACNRGLMISSYGTVSARWRGNDFLITPRNVSRWDLEPRDIVQICGGCREKGKLPSRAVEMHQAIYRDHPDVNSIFVTQSPYIMAFAVTGQPLDVRSIPESWILLQDVLGLPYSAYFNWPGEPAKQLCLERPVAIVQNDAAIVVGSSLLSAFDRLEVAEATAQTRLRAARLGPMVPISADQIEALRAKFFK